jgi:hypothetical protein
MKKAPSRASSFFCTPLRLTYDSAVTRLAKTQTNRILRTDFPRHTASQIYTARDIGDRIMRVNFGWWNVSLKQAGKKSESEARDARRLVVEMLKKLLDDYQIDVLGICEVGADDMEAITVALGTEYRCVGFFEAWSPRAECDLAILLRRSTTKLEGEEYERFFVENRVLGLGVSTTLRIFGQTFGFVLSHWPSRQWLPHRDPDRCTYGAQLRSVHQRIREDMKIQHVIFAGDYNDEPFDEALSAHLTSTRDATRLINSELVTYNPFWRSLGTHDAFLGRPPSERVSGSYRYASGRHTTWYTFDQMMFSRDFVFGGSWRLDEAATGIIADDWVVALVRDRGNKIDHLPIISVVEAQRRD